MILNSMPRWEVLGDEAMAAIERGWERLARDIGVRFDHPRALQLFAEAGQTVDGERVRFDPGFLRAQAKLAPSQFTLAARNPQRTLTIGGDHMVFAATNGPPFVRDGATRRDGTGDDLVRFLKLTQMSDVLDTPGRNIIEPNDVPLDIRHLVRSLLAIELTDRVWTGESSSDAAARDCLRLAEIVHGRRAGEGPPIIMANINVNSPLHFDVRMLEGLITYAEAGQPVIVTPFLLMGAMAPVTVAAALAQQTAEALAGIALMQLIRPGTPSVMGSFLSSTDMRSGSPSFGGPESAFGLAASGQIARSFGLPWRSGGGTLTASPLPDFQAGYEALNTLFAAFLGGANVCWQAAGWLEGGLVTSYEKFVADTELISLMCHQFSPVEFDEDALAFSAYEEVGDTGHFFGVTHTLERFRDCFWRQSVGTTDGNDRWVAKGGADHAGRAAEQRDSLLARYERPALDDAVGAEVREFVERRAEELGDPLELPDAG
jgi:trimethylamine---corrinoid protein Co-methyltransferase